MSVMLVRKHLQIPVEREGYTEAQTLPKIYILIACMLLSVAVVQIAVTHLCDAPTAHLAAWHGVFHGIFGFSSQGELMLYIVVSNSWTFSCEHFKTLQNDQASYETFL